MSQVKLLITDFDGTLVDTFEANFKAYQKAFSENGITLDEETYRKCFGFRFDDFMTHMGVTDDAVRQNIRKLKGDYYPQFFDCLRVNQPLLSMLKTFKASGGMTAVASTARKKNLMNALEYIRATDAFSLILAGEDVKHGKPNPEIYQTVLAHFQVTPDNALVFEDSEVGVGAANAAGIPYVVINDEFFQKQ